MSDNTFMKVMAVFEVGLGIFGLLMFVRSKPHPVKDNVVSFDSVKKLKK